jgi:hypothetical protein
MIMFDKYLVEVLDRKDGGVNTVIYRDGKAIEFISLGSDWFRDGFKTDDEIAKFVLGRYLDRVIT